jgi:DNA repair exonuclease SbcCD nuclease subunit
VKILHAADLHIDSPLQGLERYEGAPVARARATTREAFVRIVDLALRENVAFVVLAGDLFDTAWRDYNTGLFFLRQLERLRTIGARVVLVRGNHDFDLTRSLRWPGYVHELSVAGQSVVFEKEGVVFHGASYAERKEKDSLLPKYGPRLPDLFNVGVLHTNATRDPGHERYAPCTVGELADKGYDYWALGHVHKRQVLSAAPSAHVVYPGNPQGRHARETGDKGVYIVTVGEARDAASATLVFHPTQVMRWRHEVLELGTDDDFDQLLDRARERFTAIAEEEQGALAAVRLDITGASAAHSPALRRKAELLGKLRSFALEQEDTLWLEKVQLRTAPAEGLESLALARGLLGQLLASVERARSDESELAALGQVLEPLRSKLGKELAELEIDTANPEWLAAMLEQAEARLVESLGGDSSGGGGGGGNGEPR